MLAVLLLAVWSLSRPLCPSLNQADKENRGQETERGKDDAPFRGRGTFGAGVQRQIKSLLASKGRGLAVPGVERLRFSILGRLASSVLIEAARFLDIGARTDSLGAAAAAAGVVSDPCCLAGSAPAGLAAMAERVRRPVDAETCRGWEELLATTSVIFRRNGRHGQTEGGCGRQKAWPRGRVPVRLEPRNLCVSG